jgi:outer membrane protein OmpA-like peptidoglycan-associated protein
MKSSIYYFVSLLLVLSLAFNSHAQEDDTWTTPVITDEMTIDPEQNQKWRNGEFPFSAKPKNAWEAGIHLGHVILAGDVQKRWLGGYGLGLHLRRAINYSLSVRGELYYATSKSWDGRPQSTSVLVKERLYQQALEDNPSSGLQQYLDGSHATFARNYDMNIIGGSMEVLVNIGNLMFHRERNKWGFYTLVGAGIYIPTVKVNLLDPNGNAYNFDPLRTNVDFTTTEGRKEYRNDVKDLLDDDWETDGGVEDKVSELIDEKGVIISAHVGMGVSRKLSKRVNISFEHQVIISDNDLLDGFEYRTTLDETNNLDLVHYTNFRLNINLGDFEKRTEPLYWLNPLAMPYTDIAEVKRRPQLDLTDTDGDGVLDVFDAEINSPAGAPVDTRGITLDIDGDGVPDYKDKERFSPSGYPVDVNGVAQGVDKPYVTEDDVNKIINNKLSEAHGRDWWLPMIHFDLDKYYIKPEFHAQLYHVASVLRMNPDLKVVVKGHTDVRKPNDYNRVLSYNRAKAAIEFMVNNYDLERERFILQFGGEENPIIADLPDGHNLDKQREMQQYINRRVEFRVAIPSDKEMSRPQGPEAGQGTPGSSRPGNKYSGNKNSGY